MRLTAIGLASQAMELAGLEGFTQWDEDDSSRKAKRHYDLTVVTLLEGYSWKFANYTWIPTLLAEPPPANFNNAFQVPNDCLWVKEIGPQQRTREVVYALMGQEIWTDSNEITIKGTRRVPEENFPGYFATALVFELAGKYAIAIRKEIEFGQGLLSEAQSKFRLAKSRDSQQETAEAISTYDPLISARN